MGLARLGKTGRRVVTNPGILVLNAGSSSLKASLVEVPSNTTTRAEASWGSDASRSPGRAEEVAAVLRTIDSARPDGLAPDAVGYRVVHGGDRFTAPVLIDDAVIGGIESVRDLAPLHNDVALETIRVGRSLLPDIPHVACFDTAFHASLAPDAYRYAVPERWYREWGVRRYGFHGLSVAWSVRRAAELLDRKPEALSLVVAHLGNGASVTAVRGGRSVNTSMGFTPLEGLMMGTRSGSIDPGVLLHLIGHGLLDAGEAAEALDHASGLAGVSGMSGDMRLLEAAAAAGNERAALAITMFIARAAASISAMATSLTQLDGLVFTGGIGEHSEAVCRGIVERLAVLGLAPLPRPDPGGSRPAADCFLSDAPGVIPVLRIVAREDLVIAAQTVGLLDT